MKTSLGVLIGAPVIGSILGATGGAVAWKDHRVIGGVLGFFGGSLIGGVIGSVIAKKTIEQSVLPELESLAAQTGNLEYSTGGLVAPADVGAAVNSAGPLKINASFLAPVVSRALGVSAGSATAMAAKTAVAAAVQSKGATLPKIPTMSRTPLVSPAPAPAAPTRTLAVPPMTLRNVMGVPTVPVASKMGIPQIPVGVPKPLTGKDASSSTTYLPAGSQMTTMVR